ncbi:pyridoxamine 5'-phosphate oxidase family protein [Haliangium ochraceum]|uniref:Pyridoxamine 5'-phosphate oxidase-related FMN-binding protein n=1 Tax=Haliangium ochraceum (strain DSM 14365 / JCM 11303 / SMP-2) TaxID=502025 RepID=D0LTK7_HALO1|nr:pyridoxamine 5'-phosphate oxidase family protein [Haliangium ochraceum]ACY13902.1 pyridoxamine 5'-phosphate oxidase-related FMN- binding protein [Haliangium ochraceum DSM 14365]
MTYRSDIAFTPAVKAAQEARGSRVGYERAMAKRDWSARIDERLREFITTRDSVYFGTASKDGQPYIQHRGGPPGFLKVLDEHRLAFADYAGNRQYISLGNLSENPRAFLFLMDYPSRSRVKLWGRAAFIEDDEALLAAVSDADYDARPERVLVFQVEAWDVNCPQHITPRFTRDELRRAGD